MADIKVGLDFSDFISNVGKAEGAIDALGKRIKELYENAELAFKQERSKGVAFQDYNNSNFYTKNEKGNPVFKVDPEYASLIKDQTASMKDLTASVQGLTTQLEVNKNGASYLSPQNGLPQVSSLKLPESSNGSTDENGTKNVLQTLNIGHITGALTSALNTWAQSAGRSGIVTQSVGYSSIVAQSGISGVMEENISEQRQQGKSWNGLIKAALTIAGGLVSIPMTGGFSLLPILAGMVTGGGAADIINSGRDAANDAEIEKEVAKNTHANLWQQRYADAMELAALTGDPSNVRGAHNDAAVIAAKYGYSAEEGVAVMKYAARQGLSGDQAEGIAEDVYKYQRGTGADRGTLLGISTMSERYGAGDALAAGWAGLNASGMKTGQLDEFLRGMQRVMEDGISRGVVRSSEQVAETLTMLSNMTGNNDPMWKGEHGAQRLMEMNSGLAGTVELQSTTDVLAFRAAMKTLGEEAAPEEALALLERGITDETHGADLYKNIMELVKQEYGDDRFGETHALRNIFGLNHNTALTLHDNYDKDASSEENKELAETKITPLPESNGPELNAMKNVQQIVNERTKQGQYWWDERVPDMLTEELRKAELGTEVLTNPLPDVDTLRTMDRNDATAVLDEKIEKAKETGNKNIIDAAYKERQDVVGQWNTDELFKGMEAAKLTDWVLTNGEEIGEMLMPSQEGEIGFFTKGDKQDEEAFNQFTKYGQDNMGFFYEIIQKMMDPSFPDEGRQYLNENNIINGILSDGMTEKTGQALLEAVQNWETQINL